MVYLLCSQVHGYPLLLIFNLPPKIQGQSILLVQLLSTYFLYLSNAVSFPLRSLLKIDFAGCLLGEPAVC